MKDFPCGVSSGLSLLWTFRGQLNFNLSISVVSFPNVNSGRPQWDISRDLYRLSSPRLSVSSATLANCRATPVRSSLANTPITWTYKRTTIASFNDTLEYSQVLRVHSSTIILTTFPFCPSAIYATSRPSTFPDTGGPSCGRLLNENYNRG